MKRLVMMLVMSAVCAVIGGCKGGDTGPHTGNADSSAAPLPDQEMWDSEIILTSGGRTTARLHAAHIAKYINTQRVLLDTARVDFYNADGSHASVLTARHGRVDEKSNDLEAIGNVVVRSDQGITLETNKLFWRNELGKITTEEAVKLTTVQDTVRGRGLESDPRLENWQIKHDISGTFRRAVPVPDGRDD